jgi:hypothetical protein
MGELWSITVPTRSKEEDMATFSCNKCGKDIEVTEVTCPSCIPEPEWSQAELLDLRSEVNRLTSLLAQHERNLARLHGLLDKEGIPDARHTVCDDPECWSLLYHRIKHGLIAKIEALTASLTDALGTKPPSLPLVDLTTGEPLTVEQVLGAQKKLKFLQSENAALHAIRDEAKGYLFGLLKAFYPDIEQLNTLLGICTQIDNGLAVGLREAQEQITRLRYCIQYAKRQEGKYTLDDYIYKINEMCEIIGYHPDKESTT